MNDQYIDKIHGLEATDMFGNKLMQVLSKKFSLTGTLQLYIFAFSLIQIA